MDERKGFCLLNARLLVQLKADLLAVAQLYQTSVLCICQIDCCYCSELFVRFQKPPLVDSSENNKTATLFSSSVKSTLTIKSLQQILQTL
jgi:hypothetical protein